jgi:hypothetical protein
LYGLGQKDEPYIKERKKHRLWGQDLGEKDDASSLWEMEICMYFEGDVYLDLQLEVQWRCCCLGLEYLAFLSAPSLTQAYRSFE